MNNFGESMKVQALVMFNQNYKSGEFIFMSWQMWKENWGLMAY